MPTFMVVEHFNGNAAAIYARFHARGRLAPEGLTYVASWVHTSLDRCYQVMETADRALLEVWMADWRDPVTFEVHEVMTSADAARKAAGEGGDAAFTPDQRTR